MDFYTAIALTAVVLGKSYTALQAARLWVDVKCGAYLRGELHAEFMLQGVDLDQLYQRYDAKLSTVLNTLKAISRMRDELGDRLDSYADEGAEAPQLEELYSDLAQTGHDLLALWESMRHNDFDEKRYTSVLLYAQQVLQCAANTSHARRPKIEQQEPQQLALFADEQHTPNVEILATVNAPSDTIGWWAKQQDGPQHDAHVREALLKGRVARDIDGVCCSMSRGTTAIEREWAQQCCDSARQRILGQQVQQDQRWCPTCGEELGSDFHGNPTCSYCATLGLDSDENSSIATVCYDTMFGRQLVSYRLCFTKTGAWVGYLGSCDVIVRNHGWDEGYTETVLPTDDIPMNSEYEALNALGVQRGDGVERKSPAQLIGERLGR
jgi:hypothetical protein